MTMNALLKVMVDVTIRWSTWNSDFVRISFKRLTSRVFCVRRLKWHTLYDSLKECKGWMLFTTSPQLIICYDKLWHHGEQSNHKIKGRFLYICEKIQKFQSTIVDFSVWPKPNNLYNTGNKKQNPSKSAIWESVPALCTSNTG